jgi:hypothetical protein
MTVKLRAVIEYEQAHQRAHEPIADVFGEPIAGANDVLSEIFGLSPREVVRNLGCSHAELKRWLWNDGKLPPDGIVRSYYFTSMSRSRRCWDFGWFPETIEAAKTKIDGWRKEHKERQRKLKKEKTRIQKTVRSTVNRVFGHHLGEGERK